MLIKAKRAATTRVLFGHHAVPSWHVVKGHPNTLTTLPTASLTVAQSTDIGRSQQITTELEVLNGPQWSSIGSTAKFIDRNYKLVCWC